MTEYKHSKVPRAGEPVITRNFATGPSFFSVNLGISRSFAFGPVAQRSGQSASAKPGSSTAEKPYSLNFSIYIQNLFNRANLGPPVGNLSSPSFGESTAIAGSFGPAPVVTGSGGNRRIQLQLRFNF